MVTMTTVHVFILLLATLALSSGFILPAKDQDVDSPEMKSSRQKRYSEEEEGANPLIALVDTLFDNSDTNHDGKLDIHELWQTFNAFDGNGDARITRSEYVGFFSMGMIPGLRGIPYMSRTAAVLFHEGDMDGDRHLSRNDASIIFHNLDTDHDNLVSKNEYFERWRSVMERVTRGSQAQGYAQ